MSQLIVPTPNIGVVSPLIPSIDLISGVVGEVTKSVSVGVNEHEAHVSMTIGSSVGLLEV